MDGKIEKKGKKRESIRRLEDLGKFRRHAPEEPHAHSLSSAATGELPVGEPPVPRVEIPKNPDIETAIQSFMSAAEEGRDLTAVYESEKQWLKPEYLPEFRTRLAEMFHDRGEKISFPEDKLPAGSESAPATAQTEPVQEPAAVPEESQKPASEPALTGPKREEGPEEWSVLRKRNIAGDGIVDNRFKYWVADDGHVYIDRGDSRPRKIEHGHSMRYLEKATMEYKTLYWDKDNRAFTETNPAPEREAERKRLAQAMRSQREYTPERLAVIQERLRGDLSQRPLGGDKRDRLLKDIGKLKTYADARRVGRVIQNIRRVSDKVRFGEPPEEEATPFIEEHLNHARENLQNRLKTIKISADKFADFGKRIFAASDRATIQQISRDLAKLEPAPAQSAEKEPGSRTGRGPAIGTEAERQRLLQNLDVRAQGTVRGNVLKRLSPNKFTPHEINAEWTGGPKPESQNTYTHPDAPGMVFQEDEVRGAQETTRARRQEALNRTPAEQARWLDPNLLYASGRGAHERPESWKIVPERYIGVSIKRIPQILGNPRDEQFFGELLRAIDPNKGDLLLRFHEGRMSQEDMDFLTYGAYEYSKWMKEGEEVAAQITAGDIELMARRNPDMRNMMTFLPEGRETDMMKDIVLHLAMKNPAQLEDVRDAFKDLKKARETYRFERTEERIDEQCARVGVERKDYGAMFDLKNEAHRKRTEARLAKHVHEQAGSLRRALDWVEKVTRSPLAIPGSSYYKAILETMEASRITPHRRERLNPRSWVLDTVDTNLNTITEYLGATVADSEVRSAIAREALTNQRQRTEQAAGPTTYADVQRLANEENSQKALRTRMEQRINAVPNFRSLPSYQQDAVFSDIKSSEEERQGRGKGFFAWLSEMLFGKEFDKAASAIARRPVHV